jgi:DMSO/TMAO reductase YedYZ heme-binding membrane subunit
MIDKVFLFLVSKKERVIRLFQIGYLLIGLVSLGGIFLFVSGVERSVIYEWGLRAGRLAESFFIIVLIPGMATRYGIRNKPLSLLMIFRRYLGILMYVIALAHVAIVRIAPQLPYIDLSLPSGSVLYGGVAMVLLLPLFVTSNDSSVRRLGIWWTRVHKLIYGAMIVILLHTGLQRVSVWSGVMAVFVVLETGSYLFLLLRQRRALPTS